MRSEAARTGLVQRATNNRPLSQRWKFRRFPGLVVTVLAVTLSGGCDRSPASGKVAEQRSASVPSAIETLPRNRLDMRIDGKHWHADRELYAAVHAPGPEGGVVMGGSFGPKDRNEQVFSLILQGVKVPGQHRINSGDLKGSIVQLANLSPEQYLMGSMLGFDLAVTVKEFSREPLVVELLFNGWLTDNNGTQVAITEGRFFYRE